MRSFLRLCALLFLVSCAGVPPYQSRKIKVWNGSPEMAGICRMSSKDLKSAVNIPLPSQMIKKVHQGFIGMECMPSTDPEFKNYACLTFEDMGVLYDYIQTLLYSCKEWKK